MGIPTNTDVISGVHIDVTKDVLPFSYDFVDFDGCPTLLGKDLIKLESDD